MKKRLKILSALMLIIVAGILFVKLPSMVTVSSAETARDKVKDAVVLYIGSNSALAKNVKTQIDTNQEVTPVLINNVTYVPIRFISQSMGGGAVWEDKTQTATIKLGNKQVKLSKLMSSIQVQNINGRIYVPIRYVSEVLGKKVFYSNGLIVISDKDKILDATKDKLVIEQIIDEINVLPSVSSLDNLKKLLAKGQEGSGRGMMYTTKGMALEDTAMMNGATMNKKAEFSVNESIAQSSVPQASKEKEYSKTNTQVQGVDESDVVKTDGDYIYKVNKNKIVIVGVNDKLEKVTEIVYSDKDFAPQEIYLDSKYLVVIGNTYSQMPYYGAMLKSSVIGLRPRYISNTTVELVYDITDKKNIKLVKKIDLEGSYISSRKIGSSVYLITNKYINYYTIQQEQENLTPTYKDSSTMQDYKAVDYKDIRYFPNFQESNYMILAGFNLDRLNEEVKVSTYLGAGQNIYCSTDNLYVAVTEYKRPDVTIQNGENVKKIAPDYYNYQENTLVYRFAINEGFINYRAKGEVPGTILNQFSMDESGEYFRIATTKGQVWNTQNQAKNNVYVLDRVMSIVGKVEDIAPGERIYSTRFMGDRLYMVTFKNVDPLFVIDLKDPKGPKILGSLKIPGFSDYLHPYDENHIIGFGKDTIEMQSSWGKTGETMAYYQGMKMAMFDVTDPTNPKEMFVEKIGDRGTDSELLRNHKALMFSKEKGLLAFPISIMKVKNENGNKLEYGEFAFQGAVVYNVDLSTGFKLKGKITHMNDQDYLSSGYGYYGDKNIDRILYIDDNLFTLSNYMIKCNRIDDLSSKGEVIID